MRENAENQTNDLGNLLETCEPLEEHFGIRLDALFARFSNEYVGYMGPGIHLIVSGEVHAIKGAEIKSSFELVAAVFDSAGRVIASEQRYPAFEASKFFGFDSFSIEFAIHNNLRNSVARLLVYPAPD
jgi:hypothetical protein